MLLVPRVCLRPRNPRMVFLAKAKNLWAALVVAVQNVVAFGRQRSAILNWTKLRLLIGSGQDAFLLRVVGLGSRLDTIHQLSELEYPPKLLLSPDSKVTKQVD